jgi:hypothetical protein
MAQNRYTDSSSIVSIDGTFLHDFDTKLVCKADQAEDTKERVTYKQWVFNNRNNKNNRYKTITKKQRFSSTISFSR